LRISSTENTKDTEITERRGSKAQRKIMRRSNAMKSEGGLEFRRSLC